MNKREDIPHVWEGIFDAFPESDCGHVWDSERWVKSVFDPLPIPDTLNLADRTTPSQLSLVHEYPLPPITALLSACGHYSPLRILDFGGGGGSSFLACINSLPNPSDIEYHIVEGRKVCEKGRELYRHLKNIFFHESLPASENGFHIVHVAAALHYIRDWRDQLKQLLNYHPDILILSALNAGDIKTFASFQNYYGEKIPVWFLNIDEIVEYIQKMKYRLIYKSLLDFSFLGKYQQLPMQNFPLKYRLERKCNLIFGSGTLGE